MELKKSNFITILEDQNKRISNFNNRVSKIREQIQNKENPELDELLF